jgi:hypothetical protein
LASVTGGILVKDLKILGNKIEIIRGLISIIFEIRKLLEYFTDLRKIGSRKNKKLNLVLLSTCEHAMKNPRNAS